MRTVERPNLFGRPRARIHCVGAGGMGMGPLALYLAKAGWTVSAEDDHWSEEMAEILASAGVAIGPLPRECDLVARSSAIAPSHPTLAEATSRGIAIVRRGELLAEVAGRCRLVAVCGSHGKTTTSAMLATILRRSAFPAGYVVGGLFADGTPPAQIGSSDWLVAEIDESDGTIDRFSPEITVAVNLDWDHPDHYHRPKDLEDAFEGLFSRTRGAVLVSDQCPLSLRLAPNAATFGRSGAFQAQILSESADSMTLGLGGRFVRGEARVQARGDFNASNAAAALAAAQLMGIAAGTGLLAAYPGVRRRQVEVAEVAGVTVIEDYAHHPAEIRALLPSLRRRVRAGGRLIAVFQPHRPSRTAQFRSEFAAALALADRIHLLDVYSAGEAAIAGGTAADIYAEIKRQSPGLPVSYFPGEIEGFFCALSKEVLRGDLIVFVGAGDIDQRAREWTVRLQEAARRAQAWDAWAEGLKGRLSPSAKLEREAPLARRTTLRVGGTARVFAEPAGESDLQELLRSARQSAMAVLVLGRGSNLVVPDEGVEGVVISLGGEDWSAFEALSDGRVRVGAGLRLKNLCGLAAAAGLAGFEFLEGIPGSVGGALRMNAGAMGGWIFDVVDEVRVMAGDGQIRVYARPEVHVGYRHCVELEDGIALAAVLRPRAVSPSADVSRAIDVYRKKRHESQPREPSAGCIFKNPPGESAGRLIEESGLKGERVGGAEVSTLHANFIINRGEATSQDVVDLIRRIRARVLQAKGVDLEPEVLLYGKKWEEVL